MQLSEPSGMVEGENGKNIFMITVISSEIVPRLRRIIESGCFVGRLYIADTNNSVIRYLDLNKEGTKLLTLELKGVKPPVATPKTLKRLRSRTSADTLSIKIDGVSTNQGKLTLAISVPEGYHFSKVIVFWWTWFSHFHFSKDMFPFSCRRHEVDSLLSQSPMVQSPSVQRKAILMNKDIPSFYSRGPLIALPQEKYFARYRDFTMDIH